MHSTLHSWYNGAVRADTPDAQRGAQMSATGDLGPMPLPPGARLLDTEEAVRRLVTGDHHKPKAGGSVELDVAFVDFVRAELVAVALTADGQLAFWPLVKDEAEWARRLAALPDR